MAETEGLMIQICSFRDEKRGLAEYVQDLFL